MAVYVVGIGIYSLFVGPRWFEVAFLAVALIAAVLTWVWATVAILGFLIVLGAAAVNDGSGLASTAGLLIRTVVLGAVFYALLRLSTMLRDLVAGREAAEQVAILNERLRLGRDLHDVVVHSFTAIGLKAELADRIFTRNPDVARSEVGQIQ